MEFTTARFETTNKILNSLPKATRWSLPPLQAVTLKSGAVLSEPHHDVDYVYFPDDALISILALNADGLTLEVGLVGNEGMVGLPAILGGVTPYSAVVHKGGRAL